MFRRLREIQELDRLRRENEDLRQTLTEQDQYLKKYLSEFEAMRRGTADVVASYVWEICSAFERNTLVAKWGSDRASAERAGAIAHWFIAAHGCTMQQLSNKLAESRAETERWIEQAQASRERIRALTGDTTSLRRENHTLGERIRQLEEEIRLLGEEHQQALAISAAADRSSIAGARAAEDAAAEIERNLEGHWRGRSREWAVPLLLELAAGDECRQQALAEALGIHSARARYDLFRSAVENGLIDSEEASLGRGRPVRLYWPTDRSTQLLAAQGIVAQHGYPELRRRHRSPEQALLVLRARDLLMSWEYEVDMWCVQFQTHEGRHCAPDILAKCDARPLFVEAEVHGQVWGNTIDENRVTKWEIFHSVNSGHLYIVVPSARIQKKIFTEISLWRAQTGKRVSLHIANLADHSSDWISWDL